jgi:hypothetical protein
VLVLPVIIHADEKVVPRHHQHAPLFETLIKFLAADGQPLEPEPEENGALGFVDVVGQAFKGLAEPLDSLRGALAIKRSNVVPCERENLTGLEQGLGQGLALV